jgi:hypothetical protein
MIKQNKYNSNTLFSSKEAVNTTEKSTCQKLFLLTSPTLLLVNRAPFDRRFPIMPKRISYQLQAETNFRVRTL